jgi:hypothetical protein
MIVSASRRSDIPAFHGTWFMEQLRRGRVLLKNPFRPGLVRTVSLKPGNVDAFVFWSRDPRPFLAHLPELERSGFAYYFLLTATGYPRQLEAAIPSMEEATSFFRFLATAIGRRRVIWRYDPVIFTERTPFDFHTANFARLAVQLAPFTTRVIVSFFDPYPKVLRRLRRAGIDPEHAAGTVGQQRDLLSYFAARAAAAGLEIQSCAEECLAAGVQPGKCIDDGLLNELFGLNLPYRKDPGQRKLCLCQQSVDIGAYGTCGHNCLYCYARS